MAALDDAKAIAGLLRSIDLTAPDATERVEATVPFGGGLVRAFRASIEAGVRSGTLVPKEVPGVRFGRLAKPSDETHGFSVDVVDMSAAAGAHRHPQGEIDLSFALEGDPRFDGHPEGWLVLGPGSWHVPTVTGGRMAIVYFLPGGSITFDPPPNEGVR
jgi:hypothetical protein